MRWCIPIWVIGLVCFIVGVLGRVVLGSRDTNEVRMKYAMVLTWQVFWYGVAWVLFAIELRKTRSRRPNGAEGGGWLLWWVGVIASIAAILSSFPP